MRASTCSIWPRTRTASTTRSSEPSRSSLAINARWRSIRRRWSRSSFSWPISTVVWAAAPVLKAWKTRAVGLDACDEDVRAIARLKRVVKVKARGGGFVEGPVPPFCLSRICSFEARGRGGPIESVNSPAPLRFGSSVCGSAQVCCVIRRAPCIGRSKTEPASGRTNH